MSTRPPVDDERWKLAQRAEEEYQRHKRRALAGFEQNIFRNAAERSGKVVSRLREVGVPETGGVVLEVGSGAHGLIWRWPYGRRVALDPLAVFYRREFAFLQAGGPTIIAARGESIPLGDGSVDLLLSDNVLDHAQDPVSFLKECRRVLAPGGTLYLTVDVHHPAWVWGGVLYNTLCRAGIQLKIPAFPNHPHHFVRGEVDALLAQTGWREVARSGGEPIGSGPRKRHLFRLLTAVFFKDARYEVIAVPERSFRP